MSQCSQNRHDRVAGIDRVIGIVGPHADGLALRVAGQVRNSGCRCQYRAEAEEVAMRSGQPLHRL